MSLYQKNFIYSIMNADEMIYKGLKPMLMEHGPYHYNQSTNFSSPNYDGVGQVNGLDDPVFKSNVFGH